MANAAIIYQYGSPKEFVVEAFTPGEPEENEVLLRHEAIGLNYIDIYQRTGLYPLPRLPAVIGMEGAGIIEHTAHVRDMGEVGFVPSLAS